MATIFEGYSLKLLIVYIIINTIYMFLPYKKYIFANFICIHIFSKIVAFFYIALNKNFSIIFQDTILLLYIETYMKVNCCLLLIGLCLYTMAVFFGNKTLLYILFVVVFELIILTLVLILGLCYLIKYPEITFNSFYFTRITDIIFCLHHYSFTHDFFLDPISHLQESIDNANNKKWGYKEIIIFLFVVVLLPGFVNDIYIAIDIIYNILLWFIV